MRSKALARRPVKMLAHCCGLPVKPRAVKLTAVPGSQSMGRGQSAAHERAYRVVRGVLLGLPLLSLALLLAVASAYNPPPLNSGDPLLDAAYADFDARGALPWEARLLRPQMATYHEYGWDGTRLSRLRQQVDERFTTQPRYWELLFRSSSNFAVPEKELAALKARGLEPQYWFAEEARRRGSINVPLFIGLLGGYDNPWYAAGKKEVTLDQAQNPVAVAPATPQTRQPWPRERWALEQRGFAAASAGELDSLLEELRRLDPDDAAVHYESARLLCAAGRMQEAQAAVAAGNRCEQMSSFVTLDATHFWQNSSDRPARLKLVEQHVLGSYATRDLPNFVQLKNCFKQLALDAAERGDRAALTELHRFACRYTQGSGDELITHLVALVNCGSVRLACEQHSQPALSPEERQALSHLRSLVDQMRNEARNFNQFQTTNAPSSLAFPLFLGGNPGPLDGLAWQALDFLSNGHWSSLAMLELFAAMEEMEPQFAASRLLPIWKQLARFDYATLSFTADRAVLAAPAGK